MTAGGETFRPENERILVLEREYFNLKFAEETRGEQDKIVPTQADMRRDLTDADVALIRGRIQNRLQRRVREKEQLEERKRRLRILRKAWTNSEWNWSAGSRERFRNVRDYPHIRWESMMQMTLKDVNEEIDELTAMCMKRRALEKLGRGNGRNTRL